MTRRRMRAGLAAVFLSVAAASSAAEVEFRAFVQASYRLRADLDSWSSTAQLLSALLGGVRPVLSVDGSPDDLVALLSIPSVRTGTLRVLYLGLHVESSGRLLFANGAKMRPGEIAAGVQEKGGGWTPHIVIVDTCHAASFAYDGDWLRAFPVDHLFASDTNQLAWELNLDQRQPVHLRARYPEAYDLIAAKLGAEWNGKISDLGFRVAKLAVAQGGLAEGKDSIRAIAGVAREPVKSARFRQSTILWREAHELKPPSGGANP